MLAHLCLCNNYIPPAQGSSLISPDGFSVGISGWSRDYVAGDWEVPVEDLASCRFSGWVLSLTNGSSSDVHVPQLVPHSQVLHLCTWVIVYFTCQAQILLLYCLHSPIYTFLVCCWVVDSCIVPLLQWNHLMNTLNSGHSQHNSSSTTSPFYFNTLGPHWIADTPL